MSLRARLLLQLTLIVLVMFGAGAWLVLHNARAAVATDVGSNARLAVNLLRTELIAHAADAVWLDEPRKVVAEMAALEDLRFVAVETDDGQVLGDSVFSARPAGLRAAPEWFAALVEPADPILVERIDVPGRGGARIAVSADPHREIVETWHEVRTLLVLFVAGAAIANVLVFVSVGASLRPVNRIVRGLEAIEQGEYRTRLATPPLPELARIAARVNRMAEALVRARAQARYLAQRLIEVQEDERRVLARELHDELGQTMTAIRAVAVSIGQRVGEGPTAEAARSIAETAGSTYARVRRLMHRLRPPVLDELGLTSAIEQMVDDWNGHHPETFCALEIDAGLPRPAPAVEIALFRILQEVLTNVSRHSHARRVEVGLSHAADTDTLALNIRDDGVGFIPETVQRGLGLLGIEERVGALHGSCRITSARGAGVRIDIEVPSKGSESGDERGDTATHPDPPGR